MRRPVAMLALCLLVLCAASAVGRVIVDVTTQGPPIVYVAASEIAAGATLEVAYGAGQRVVQSDQGACAASTTLAPIVDVAPQPAAGTAALSFPLTSAGAEFFIAASTAGTAGCVRVRVVVYDWLVDVSASLLPRFPVSVVALPGQWVVLFSSDATQAERFVAVTDTQSAAPDARPFAPAPVSWPAGDPFAKLRVTAAQGGHTFLLASSVHGGVRVWLIVAGPRDVRVTLNATTAPLDVRVPLGGRIIWEQTRADSSYLRLSDSAGRVVPPDSHLYTVAYGANNVGDLFALDQAPLQQRMRAWATPAHIAPATWLYADMLRPQLGPIAYRAVVLSASGAVAPPADNANATAPPFEDYFQLSRYGIKCDCTLGPAAPACAVNNTR